MDEPSYFTWNLKMKRNSLGILIFILLFTSPLIAFGSDQTRTALIIGNSDYRTAPLNNPVNDARDMADALRQLKFKVIEKINANKKDIILSIDEFYNQLRRSDVGIFYYAGHGMQIQGTNYLIPVDAHVTSEADIQFEAIDAGRVLGKMNDAGNKMNIVILDACRDNPFKRSFRTERQGLAQMDAPKGTIIAYATAPGSVAAEGTGRNGIYTKHLLKSMSKPELSVMDVFREAGLGVMQETQDKQIPWVSTTPIQRYYLAGGSAVIQKLSTELNKSQIEITSNVSDARILIDGREVGTTPVSKVEVSPGSHRIHVEKEGYNPYEKHVRVKAGRTFSMQVQLDEKKPQKGRLYVETEPDNAKVYVLDTGFEFYQGMELDPNRYHVEVSADGYETKKTWLALKAGEDKSIFIQLEKRYDAGNLRISILGISGKWVNSPKAGKLFVMRGKARNGYDHARGMIKVNGKLFSKGKKLEKSETIFCGNNLTEEELNTLDVETIKKRLQVRAGKKKSNMKIVSGRVIPFMIVFSDLPENLDDYTIEVVESFAASEIEVSKKKKLLTSKLFVKPEPVDARVRILNIEPKFYQGIELDPGKYHIEVSSDGYTTKKMWVALTTDEDKNIDIRHHGTRIKYVKS